mgnify:CR=1 FL=1
MPGLNGRDRKVRFGLIGAGRIADSYMQSFSSASNASLVAVADVRAEAAKALGEAARCKAYESHTQLMDAEVCDAVIVATPPSTHEEICLDALSRSIPVLCEKPVCMRLDTAIRLRDIAEQAGVLFTMASKFRYADDVVRAKAIVTSGLLGKVVLFENTFMARVDMTSRWNSNPSISGGGVLIDNGTHSVDIMRYFLGPLSEIWVAECCHIQGLPVEETVRVLVRSNCGVLGSMDLSWSLNKEADYYVVIYGTQGTLRVGWKQSSYRQSSASDWVVFGKGYDKVSAFRNQIENFAGAILGTDTLRITADDAIASVEAVQAAYKAMEQGQWTPVSTYSQVMAAAAN